LSFGLRSAEAFFACTATPFEESEKRASGWVRAIPGLLLHSRGSGAVVADAILRHIDAEADAVGIEVTLYLPWGVATGITVPSRYFGNYVAKFFNRNDAEDVAGRIGALEPSRPESFCISAKPAVTSQPPWSSMTPCATTYPMCPRGQLPASRGHQPRRRFSRKRT